MHLSPFCFLHGIKFQKLAKTNWDEPVNKNVRKDWAKWVNDLSTVKFITLPKCYFKGQIEILNSTLHVFTDASVLAFVAVIYLVIQTVTSKTRVAPLMNFSLPRLELLGALMGARLINCVHEALTEVLYVNEEIVPRKFANIQKFNCGDIALEYSTLLTYQRAVCLQRICE